MTVDEKLALIAEDLRLASQMESGADAVADGSVLELALCIMENYGEDDALAQALTVISPTDAVAVAKFCKLYRKYGDTYELPFLRDVFTADLPDVVVIPEIPRLEGAVESLRRCGIELKREYGESFTWCAADVESGRSRYVLLPMRSPDEGHLRSFDSMCDRYGLTVHAVINVNFPDDGVYAYKLCGVGYADDTSPKNRLSFTADAYVDAMNYLGGISVFGANVLSVSTEQKTAAVRVKATLDITGLDRRELSGLYMYLTAVADVIVDGYYNEY